MKCLRCGAENNGTVCDCGFDLAADTFVTLSPMDSIQLLGVTNITTEARTDLVFTANWDNAIPVITEERLGDTSHLNGVTENVNGYCFNRGYLIQDMEEIADLVPINPLTKSCSLNMARILVTDRNIEDTKTANWLMSKVKDDSDLLIIANDYTIEALEAIYMYPRKSKCVALRAPGYGDRRKALLADIAFLTGADIASGLSGGFPVQVKLGFAENVVVQPDLTVIARCMADKKTIEERVAQLQREYDDTSSEYDREKLAERIGLLKKGVRIVWG